MARARITRSKTRPPKVTAQADGNKPDRVAHHRRDKNPSRQQRPDEAKHSQPIGNPVPLVVSVALAAVALGVDVCTIRRMRDRGELRVAKFGGNVRVPVTELARLSAMPLSEVTALLKLDLRREGTEESSGSE